MSENKPSLYYFIDIIREHLDEDINECMTELKFGNPNYLIEIYRNELNKIADKEWCEKMGNELYLLLNILLQSIPLYSIDMYNVVTDIVYNHLYNDDMCVEFFD